MNSEFEKEEKSGTEARNELPDPYDVTVTENEAERLDRDSHGNETESGGLKIEERKLIADSSNMDRSAFAGGHFVKSEDLFRGLYAGFWMRFWAYLLDLIVIGSITRMIINPVFRALDIPLFENGIFSPMTIATALVFYLYFVLMTKVYGQTLGKMVFGLKVVDLNGKDLTWGTVIFREWIGRFISATVMVLYLVVAFTEKKQGLHDLFADTTVIIESR